LIGDWIGGELLLLLVVVLRLMELLLHVVGRSRREVVISEHVWRGGMMR